MYVSSFYLTGVSFTEVCGFRFCSECKSKVLRAYSLLLGEGDQTTEKSYCPALYDGLKCCPGEKHIHVSCETDFMSHLISRAELELAGS